MRFFMQGTTERQIPTLDSNPDEIADFLTNGLSFPSTVDKEAFVWHPGTTSGLALELRYREKGLDEMSYNLAQADTYFPWTRYLMPWRAAMLHSTSEHPMYTLAGTVLPQEKAERVIRNLAYNTFEETGTAFIAQITKGDMAMVHLAATLERDILNRAFIKGQHFYPYQQTLARKSPGYMELAFDVEGMPTLSAAHQIYNAFSNFFFIPQIASSLPSVARLIVNSDRADFRCNQDPGSMGSKLGVRPRAKGARVGSYVPSLAQKF